jgi:hypothetical protein
VLAPRTIPSVKRRHLGSSRAREGSNVGVVADSPQIEELRAEARYRRERYDLYRAKMYGPRLTTMARLRELERAHQGAEARLRRAQQERASHNSD